MTVVWLLSLFQSHTNEMTQTGLYNHGKWLETWHSDLGSRGFFFSVYVAKTKALMGHWSALFLKCKIMFSHETAQLILLTLFIYNNNEKKQKEYKKEKKKKMKIDRNNNNSDKINIKMYCQKEERKKKMGHVKERLPVVWPRCKWIKVKEGRNEIM